MEVVFVTARTLMVGLAAALMVAFLTTFGFAQFEVPGIQPSSGSGESIDFGVVPVGQTGTASYTFKNLETSETSVTVTIYLPGPPFGLQGAPSGPFTLAPGQSITFGVTFTPTAAGDYTGSFTITARGGYPVQEKTTTVYLTGRGSSGGEVPPAGEAPPTTGITVPFPLLPSTTEVPTGAVSGTTDEDGKFKLALSPTTTVAGRLTKCEDGSPLPNLPFQMAKTDAGFSLFASGYEEEDVTKFSKFSIMGLTSYDLGDVCLTKEDCEAIRREYEALSRQIEEKKKECDCESLKRELAELKAKLADAEEDLDLSKQKKAKLAADLNATQLDFDQLLRRVSLCYAGQRVVEYANAADLAKKTMGQQYRTWRRGGVPGGIAFIGDWKASALAFLGGRCSDYASQYGETLRESCERLHDLRAKKYNLEKQAKDTDAKIAEIERRIADLNAAITAKKAELDACIQACLDEVKKMEQRRDALIEAHKECLEKLEKERQEKLRTEYEKREAEGEIGKASGQAGYAEDEAKAAEEAISNAEEEIKKHIKTEEAQSKLDYAKKHCEEGKRALEEAKKKLKEAKKACEDGEFKKARELAKEAREKAANAYKELLRAKQGAKGARSEAGQRREKCVNGTIIDGTKSSNFIWEEVLDFVMVPYRGASGGEGSYSDSEIEEQLKAMKRYEQGAAFIQAVDLLRSTLQGGGAAAKSLLKGITKGAVVTRAAEDLGEIAISFNGLDTLFNAWKNIIMAACEVYVKVSGRTWEIGSYKECVNGEWKTVKYAKPMGDPKTTYVYVGVIQAGTEEERKKQLVDLCNHKLPMMIRAHSISIKSG
ncbi:hypothetical protein DRJ23_04550 [Candidatus Acetothermia bacterium]|nr:MAG: hypothetical protein DRJ23_04550 [Candidatus Acetothermia bacterium]